MGLAQMAQDDAGGRDHLKVDADAGEQHDEGQEAEGADIRAVLRGP